MKKVLCCAMLATSTTWGIAACSAPCNCKPQAAVTAPSAAKAPLDELPANDLSTLPKLSRTDFNRLAATIKPAIFWQNDSNKNGLPEIDEIALIGDFSQGNAPIKDSISSESLSNIYRRLVEMRRHEAIAKELSVGLPTLVYNDLSKVSDGEKEMVRHIIKAADIIENIYAKQVGSANTSGCFSKNDSLSQALYQRNQGFICEAPGVAGDPFCHACHDFRPTISGLYPQELAVKEGFCADIAKEPNAEELFSPFTVVKSVNGHLQAVPYNEVWGEEMQAVANELKAAATALPENEAPLKAYLEAASAAFLDNNWEPADEAWANMNVNNSRWYLRIGPDEVYFEPCNQKAGFHVSFALIDKDSIYWQERLTPIRQEMEESLSALVPAYKARNVTVHLPDFIEIVLNAGNSRNAMGATVGQSLPNWGKISQEGRGRTVVMSNLYTDPDSLTMRHEQAISMFGHKTMAAYTDDKRLTLLDIILHELTHNLGPHTDYIAPDGSRPGSNFDGMTATILEELKAQTGALYYVDFLRAKGLLSPEETAKVYAHSIFWCFGHLSRGLFEASGKPKPYSMLSAIQLAFLQAEGAVTFHSDGMAANGKEKGYFEVNFDQMAAAAQKLMSEVVAIKVSGDAAKAKEFIDKYTIGSESSSLHLDLISERLLRHPKASFVYSYTL